MKTTQLLKITLSSFVLAFGLMTFTACSDDSETPTTTVSTKFTVGADVDNESYFLTTDEISSGDLTIVGNGYEGWAGLSASQDGYLYVINNTEGLTEKFELTENGPVLEASISNAVLTAGAFFRYIQITDNGDLFLMSSPNDDGYTPYAIIDLDTFTASSSGFISFPTIDEKVNLWANAVVQDGKIYFGSTYGNADWTGLSESLTTIVFDYPSLTNVQVLTSDASAGALSGYRTNGSFATDSGDIFQYNIQSELWFGHDEVADEPAVFVKISNGAYDDEATIDFTAHFGEAVNIWNAWYAEGDIAYANVIRVSDLTEWGDLSQNTGTLVEVNLSTGAITELNLPDATFVNIFSLDCVEDGKFFIPVNTAGGDANIYEITIGGGSDGFTQGAALDGANVFVSTLLKN